MTPVEILIAARKRIRRPKAWTQGSLAVDEFGDAVPTFSRHARAWCSAGAIIRVSPGESPAKQAARAAARTLLRRAIRCDEAIWNDAPGRRHATVLRAFDRAIKLAKEST